MIPTRLEPATSTPVNFATANEMYKLGLIQLEGPKKVGRKKPDSFLNE